MPKDDKSADKQLDGVSDGAAQRGTEPTAASMPGADIISYILDMVVQLAGLAEDVGNDALATNLTKAVQLERASGNDPSHPL